MKLRILYVEDEPFLGKIVKEALESQGFEVLWINDGALVINAFSTFVPDICVLDIMLPNVDGLSLGKQLRNLSPDLPIIFLTAKITTDDLVKGFEYGGTDYIKKPFSVKELIVRIKNQMDLKKTIDSHRQGSNFEIKLGDFRFLPAKFELLFKDQQMKLSSRESQVLNILAAHPNQTVERKKLLLSVWGDDSYFNSRNLDVYIRKLREHFLPDPRIEILTLKGVGYQFIIPE